MFSHLALALWHGGYPDQAETRANQAIALAKEEPVHAHNLAFAHWYASYILLLSRRIAAAKGLADAVVEIATKHRMPLWLGWGLILQGSAIAQQGDGLVAAELISRGTEAALGTGAGYLEPFHLGLLAEAFATAGEFEKGLATVSRAITRANESGQKGNYAELHRLQGELLRCLPEPNIMECETSFRSAVAIAHEQGARGYELRAALSLGRFFYDHAKSDNARKILTPVYDNFCEGLGTLDLQETKSLLDALAE